MAPFPFPPMPALPSEQVVSSTGLLRYEDCAQDGRLIPLAIPTSLSTIWRELMPRHPAAEQAVASGIVPILTRLVLTAEASPIRVDRPLAIRGGFQLAHDRDGDEVSRLFVNMWTEIHGTSGRIGPGATEGPRVHAGSLFAEHVFTRLFAPPDQRRVTRLDVPGLPPVPEARYEAAPPRTATEAPAGARWIDELAPDPVEVAFTLDQTDANQHVNSLVYVRVFIEAAARRLAAGGHSLRLRSRAVDVAYRKPCFAGDRVRAYVRLYEGADGLGAAGHLEGGDGKPRCYVRVAFAP